MSARATDNPEIVSFAQAKQPLAGGIIAPNDIASVCVHLLTEGSRAMTGQVIAVDAGWSVI